MNVYLNYWVLSKFLQPPSFSCPPLPWAESNTSRPSPVSPYTPHDQPSTSGQATTLQNSRDSTRSRATTGPTGRLLLSPGATCTPSSANRPFSLNSSPGQPIRTPAHTSHSDQTPKQNLAPSLELRSKASQSESEASPLGQHTHSRRTPPPLARLSPFSPCRIFPSLIDGSDCSPRTNPPSSHPPLIPLLLPNPQLSTPSCLLVTLARPLNACSTTQRLLSSPPSSSGSHVLRLLFFFVRRPVRPGGQEKARPSNSKSPQEDPLGRLFLDVCRFAQLSLAQTPLSE